MSGAYANGVGLTLRRAERLSFHKLGMSSDSPGLTLEKPSAPIKCTPSGSPLIGWPARLRDSFHIDSCVGR